MRFSVDPWDPGYGSSTESDALEPSTAEVALGVEMPAESWHPIPAPAPVRVAEPGAAPVLFVDGVRRVEARVWIERSDGGADFGLCASFAAGAVRCDGSARLVEAEVGRALVTGSGSAAPVATRAGEFVVTMAAGEGPDALTLALQERMRRAEVAATERALVALAGEVALVVVDGPLRGRDHLPGTVGSVKTHHVQYLPPEQHALVGRLGPGERTPVFTMRTAWSRHSWYLRLPGATGSPWAGVVRVEAPVDLSRDEVVDLATRTAALLPRFASARHKDARAPQNLYPVGGLERELRRRLGDPQLVYRALLRAAAR